MALPNIINDINNIKSTYLPLSGGTLTGRLDFAQSGCGGGYMYSSNNTFFVGGRGQDGKDTSFIRFYGLDSESPGSFVIHTRNNDGGWGCGLFGNNEGGLWWNDKQIVRSVNGINADSRGNVQTKPFIPFAETGCSSFDDLPEGFYYINSDPEAGRPTSNWGVLRCCRNGGTPFQIYEDDISAKSWKRWFAGGAWTSWIEIPSLSSSWYSGYNGFRIWNDGLIEQWGFGHAAHGGRFSYHTPFTSGNYCIYFQLENVDAHYIISAYDRQTTSCYTLVYWTTNYGTGTVPCYWYARGF